MFLIIKNLYFFMLRFKLLINRRELTFKKIFLSISVFFLLVLFFYPVFSKYVFSNYCNSKIFFLWEIREGTFYFRPINSDPLLGPYDRAPFICDKRNYTSFTGNILGQCGSCCGDSGLSDDFYNGSLGCANGIVCGDDPDEELVNAGRNNFICGCSPKLSSRECDTNMDGDWDGICEDYDCISNKKEFS